MDAPAGHARDVLAWHGASAVCMGLMAVAAVPAWFAGAGVALFAGGLAWCGVQLVRQASRATYARLGICLAAMVVMLVPARGGPAPASGHAMPMPMPMPTSTGPSTVALVLAAALVVVAVLGVRTLAAGRTPGASRTGTACEAVLAAAMAAMLVGLV